GRICWRRPKRAASCASPLESRSGSRFWHSQPTHPPKNWPSHRSTALPSTTTTCTERRSGRSNPLMPRTLFADTFYWIALIFPRDAFHAAVSSFSRTLGSVRLLTTDEVLTEVLSHFAGL